MASEFHFNTLVDWIFVICLFVHSTAIISVTKLIFVTQLTCFTAQKSCFTSRGLKLNEISKWNLYVRIQFRTSPQNSCLTVGSHYFSNRFGKYAYLFQWNKFGVCECVCVFQKIGGGRHIYSETIDTHFGLILIVKLFQVLIVGVWRGRLNCTKHIHGIK